MLLCEEDRSEPTTLELDDGILVAFSTCSPHKTENEDAAAMLEYPGGRILAVADGMGGMNAGRRASRLALKTLDHALRAAERRGTDLQHAAIDGIQRANEAVLGLGIGAGTTLAAVLLEGDRARSLHVGDAFVLHVGQRGKIKSQTIPHSPTGYAVEAGLLDEGAALVHEERHLVSNHVGMEGMRIEVGGAHTITARDTILVASDGLADNLTPEEIVEITRKGSLERAGRRLREVASERMQDPAPKGRGNPDDLTFVLFRRRALPAKARA